jgi:hypothetical protein
MQERPITMWQTYIETVENVYVKEWPSFDEASNHIACYLADKWRAKRPANSQIFI